MVDVEVPEVRTNIPVEYTLTPLHCSVVYKYFILRLPLFGVNLRRVFLSGYISHKVYTLA